MMNAHADGVLVESEAATLVRRQNLEPAVVGPVDLTVRKGEFIAIVGENGCGKSAFLRMVAGLDPVTSGRILVSGKQPSVRGGNLGYVFRTPMLFGWRTVIRNVLLQSELNGLPAAESLDRARRLLAWMGLAGYEGRRPDELSQGVAQGVCICRALAHNPSLLLMDEPFRALDFLAAEQASAGLQRLWMETGTTVILATSNLQEALLLADRVAVMSPAPGRIVKAIPVDLPRPRRLDKTTLPRIIEYGNEIRMVLQAQGILW